MQLILASSSPRRRQLLDEAGWSYLVSPPDPSAETAPVADLGPRELVEYLARQKAANVAGRHETGIVLAADTVAVCGGEILGKPRDRDDAQRMLECLSGRRHQVWSAICLWRRPDDRVVVRSTVTEMEMEPLSETRREAYLNSGQWAGKAGAFGYQDGLDWLRVIEGSESNVVGLPLELLAEMLREFEAP